MPLIVGSLFVVVLVVVGALMLTGRKPPSPANTTQNASSSAVPTIALPNNGEISFTGTVFDLADKKGNYECTFSIPDAEGKPTGDKGTVWVTEGKARSTISMQSPGGNIVANALYMDNKVYTWSSVNGSAPVGFVFSENNAPNLVPGQATKTQEIKQNLDYTCKPWTIDASKFELPKNVTFN